MKTCIIDGCGGRRFGHGWCNKHYARWRAHGDPNILKRTENGAPKAWLDWAFEQETDECLLWPFALRGGPYEYGQMQDGYPHRIICERRHGPCPQDKECRHHCGRGLCCNKRHLSWSTHIENESDKAIHGTNYNHPMWGYGLDNPQTKLSESDKQEILKYLQAPEALRLKDIADMYGVTAQRIWQIKRDLGLIRRR
jgi:hypothetical protein